MVLRFASIRGLRTQHHVSRSRFFSSARTVLFRVNAVECTETLIGNTIRNPPSQSSKTPHGPSGKDLSCAPSQTTPWMREVAGPFSFMDFVPQHYKGIFVSQNYKGIPLYGFGQCLPGGWGYSPDCWAALPGLFSMWRINSLATSNCSPVHIENQWGERMRTADQECSWRSRNLQKGHKLRALQPFSRLAMLIFVGLSGIPAAAQSYAYVPTHKSDSVAVVNTASNSVVAIVPVGVQPLQAAISPDGAFAYITNSGWFLGNNDVSVISTAANAVIASIPVGRFPVGVAFTPNGALAYVANQNSNDVSVINTATRTVVATIPVGVNPWGVAVTPDGAFAYVTNQATNNVSVINTATSAVVATIPVGNNPVGLAITPNGAFAYVANYLSSSVSVISTATNTVVNTVSTPVYPIAIAITPNGASAYVATNWDSIVTVIDTASNTVTASVAVGSIPRGVAITPDGAFAYVSNRMSDDVSVISTASNTVVTTISGVALLPEGIAIKP